MNQWCCSARCVIHAAPPVLHQRELRPTDVLCFPPFFVFLLTLTQFAMNYCITYFRTKFNTFPYFVQTGLYFHMLVLYCWEFDILCWKHNRKIDVKSQIHYITLTLWWEIMWWVQSLDWLCGVCVSTIKWTLSHEPSRTAPFYNYHIVLNFKFLACFKFSHELIWTPFWNPRRLVAKVYEAAKQFNSCVLLKISSSWLEQIEFLLASVISKVLFGDDLRSFSHTRFFSIFYQTRFFEFYKERLIFTNKSMDSVRQ